MKSYAFRMFFQNPEISVRSDGIYLQYDEEGVKIASRGKDPFSQHVESKDEENITLILSSIMN